MNITINANAGSTINIFGNIDDVEILNDAECFDFEEYEEYPNGIRIKNLNNFSWDKIDAIGADGYAREAFGIGAQKNVSLKNGENITLRIIGFYHDKDEGGDLIPISWEMVGVMRKEYYMNKGCANKGGWRDSDMRKYLNEEIYHLLPDDLKKVLKPAAKKNRISDTEDIVITVDKLWLKSEQELHGRKIYSYGGEGRQYEYYKQEDTPYYKCDEDGEGVWHWLRSPYSGYTTYFCSVHSGGYASFNFAGTAYGVSFGLCV